jgi:hypothetical protein
MHYLKALIYPLMTGAFGFIAISIPFAYALQNALIPLESDGPGRAVGSPAWLYYDGTMLIWLISLLCAMFAKTITRGHSGRQLTLFAPVYAPLCYAIVLLVLIHYKMI